MQVCAIVYTTGTAQSRPRGPSHRIVTVSIPPPPQPTFQPPVTALYSLLRPPHLPPIHSTDPAIPPPPLHMVHTAHHSVTGCCTGRGQGVSSEGSVPKPLWTALLLLMWLLWSENVHTAQAALPCGTDTKGTLQPRTLSPDPSLSP